MSRDDQVEYRIYPAIGVARLGNSPDEFYIEPQSIGGLPLDVDETGCAPALSPDGDIRHVKQFKDGQGRIKRQAAWFRVFEYKDGKRGKAVNLLESGDTSIESMEWTVHIANKKAAWYNFSELVGNPLTGVPYPEDDLRNAEKITSEERQKLIIDPGPRTLKASQTCGRAEFSEETIPADYPHGSFPYPPGKAPKYGEKITTLGEMRCDPQGRLLVLGGFGKSGGDTEITSFAGADSWHDDTADGQVICRLKLKGKTEPIILNAWVIVGSPKYAPELVNTSTLADMMVDVAMRNFGLDKQIYKDGGYNTGYVVNFDRDVAPILRTPADYRWVANVPSMLMLSTPDFDPRDASEANKAKRQAYADKFRDPGGTGFFGYGGLNDPRNGQTATLFDDDGMPMMPLNAGSNAVSNTMTQKFLTLTETQFFFLQQWADGKFTTEPPEADPYGIDPIDLASVGNCVGLPNCPGIEVTWNSWNPPIYDPHRPIALRPAKVDGNFNATGLSPSADECVPGSAGVEPGDMSKRMAIPWQADFFQCSVQYVNFTNPEKNKSDEGIPLPPTYYAYWWPPQAPWQVINGELSAEGQAASGLPAGQQALYSRGINTFSQMIQAWSYLGFVHNVVEGPTRELFPYFVERERNHDQFTVASVAVGQPINVITGANENFQPVWFLTPDAARAHSRTPVKQGLGREGGPRA